MSALRLFAAVLLLSLAVPVGGAEGAGGLLAWRVMGGDARGRAACQDGDARCDHDGTADGVCTFGVALCLEVAAGSASERRAAARRSVMSSPA